jgi:Biotin synthase and related enzymes
MIDRLLKKIDEGVNFQKEDAVELLSVENGSHEYKQLVACAANASRRVFGSSGYIFAQIGLNFSPCSGNCKFCSLAKCNHVFSEPVEKSPEEVLSVLHHIDFSRVSTLFLMTTADFDAKKFLEMGAFVRCHIPPKVSLVANTADFDLTYALRLKDVGFTGAYHIVRLREGIDTDFPVEQRIATLDAITAAGLQLYYCVEPIGPEHTYEELATEMLRAREYHVDIMAAMRRVNVPGTACEDRGMINDAEMAKIVAVTRLVSMPRISMNVHEPLAAAMSCGVNQLYTELGINPRDTNEETEQGRGYDIDHVSSMLEQAGYYAFLCK